MMQIVPFVIISLVGFSTHLAILRLQGHLDLIRFQETLQGDGRKGHRYLLIRLLVPVIHRIRCDGTRRRIAELLILAGDGDRLSVDEWAAQQSVFFSISLIGLLIVGYGLIVSAMIAIVLVVVFAAGNFYFRISERRAEIRRRLPVILDMLSLSVEAGLGLFSAVLRIVDRGEKDVVTAEFYRMTHDVRLGMPQGEALRRMGERLSDPMVDAFVGTLIQSGRIGSPIAPLLRAYAEKIRFDRFQRAERAGAVAAEKVLLPLVLLVMPSVFIIIFGPLFVMWKSGTFGTLL